MPRVFITGVNRGLGLEFVKQYAEQGWDVHGSFRDPARASEVLAFADVQSNVTLHELDVCDSHAVQELAVSLKGTAIDLLILNAGVMGERSLKLGELEAEDFTRVLQVNVVAPALCVQSFKSHVVASERKMIVGIGSILGSVASNVEGGRYGYRSSKAGLNAVIRSVSCDLRDDGVVAVSIHPGWVITDMGGSNAHITTRESVQGMRDLIEDLDAEASGRFYSYAGEELPW